MERKFWIGMLIGVLASTTAIAGNSVSAEDKIETAAVATQEDLLRRPLFTVSSDEFDASDSLNRISGNIDLGFSAPSQSYKSTDHYTPGPFSREKAVEST